ncbi:MAG TPA: response regulator [Terriglobales bacterium]|nr:response regulator [Terriglobales bacterium]
MRASRERKVVLCIDDNRRGLAIRKVFQEASGYEALAAECAADALELLRKQKVDAVLLDFRMPDMCGTDLAARIRHAFPHLPIVMLSGYLHEIPSDSSRVVDRLLHKGDPAAKLLETLRELTGETASSG